MGSRNVASQSVETRPFLITFSGIDGAGKTTQIEQLSSCLQNLGLRVARLSFWDNVAVWSKFRAGVGGRTAALQDARDVDGRTFAPKNNKHVRKWYLSAAQAGLYLLDVVRLRRLLASQGVKDSDVVIFDRYVYDQITNIDSRSFAAHLYGKAVLKRAPVPDLAFVIDASPTAAFARKAEYPLEFVHKNRQSFLRLREIAPELIVISEGSPEEVRGEIYFHILRSRLLQRPSFERETERTPDSLRCQQTSCRVRNEPTASV